MYSGQIRSSGPRYCPSIEDKVVRFADKERHQLFLEPEGRNTREVYVNGISTSLPRDVQDAMFRLIPGLERAEIMRYGYAVEYDYAPPEQLRADAGNEARRRACTSPARSTARPATKRRPRRGSMAGANAALALRGDEPLVLGRDQAYIGVLIDDLVTRGVDEPYRMFTSRAEYRLLLRHDNADRRLTPLGWQIGLVDARALAAAGAQRGGDCASAARCWKRRVASEDRLASCCGGRRSTWDDRGRACAGAGRRVSREVAEQVRHDVKYAGYVARQEVEVARQQRLAEKRIPDGFDFAAIAHLRAEAREKLSRVRPDEPGPGQPHQRHHAGRRGAVDGSSGQAR